MKQTILGAGGAVGIELAKELIKYTSDIRLVSRNPLKINPTDELLQADLNIRDDVFKSVRGSSVVYIAIGFEYKTSVWQEKWPVFIKNVIDACIEFKCKLVFLDNVYSIEKNNFNNITELSIINPSSVKGKIRAKVLKQLYDAMNLNSLNLIIARSADYLSEYKENSLVMILIYENLLKGKKAQWFCNSNKIHSISYVPDIAYGLALLGNTNSSYNQTWNLPTTSEKITGYQLAKIFANEMNKPLNLFVIPKWILRIFSVFNSNIMEIYDIKDQFENDYFFNSEKFNLEFNFKPTPIKKAIHETLYKLGYFEQI